MNYQPDRIYKIKNDYESICKYFQQIQYFK
jgi:hypothetical protein